MKHGIMYFYTNGSATCEKVKEALDSRHIEYVAIPPTDDLRKVPALASNSYIFEGIDEIRRYLLPELSTKETRVGKSCMSISPSSRAG